MQKGENSPLNFRRCLDAWRRLERFHKTCSVLVATRVKYGDESYPCSCARANHPPLRQGQSDQGDCRRSRLLCSGGAPRASKLQAARNAGTTNSSVWPQNLADPRPANSIASLAGQTSRCNAGGTEGQIQASHLDDGLMA